MSWILVIGAVLALLPAVNTWINLFLLKTPPMPRNAPRVAILIPARNEQAGIAACIEAALSSVEAWIEVIVLDDHSTDGTREILERFASQDRRFRFAQAPELPAGMRGKAHACQILSQMTDSPFLLFIDADVRLDPTAAARLALPEDTDLVSGVPNQICQGLVECAVIPMINVLLLGYLPIGIMRTRLDASLGAACGQLIMVRASAYRHTGGHASIASYLHDGLQLPKLFRRHGFRTDLIDATPLAQCRMYDSAPQVFAGFAKNATEGMARPAVLPLWTLLLAGGHLWPLIASCWVIYQHAWSMAGIAVIVSTGLLVSARVAQAVRCRESWKALALHPLGIVLTLWIQWLALVRFYRGNEVTWRGRSYAPRH